MRIEVIPCFDCFVKKMNIERWKIIPEFPDYAISKLGRVKSLPRKNRNARAEWITKEKILKEHYRNERAYVNVYKNKKQHKIFIHQQVAKLFVYNPNPKKYTITNHINEDKKDNKATNLEWCTYSYNLNYGSRKHFQKKSRGQWLEFTNVNTNVTLCCYSKSDFFKYIGMSATGDKWKKLNKCIDDNLEFYGYKVIQIKK